MERRLKKRSADQLFRVSGRHDEVTNQIKPVEYVYLWISNKKRILQDYTYLT